MIKRGIDALHFPGWRTLTGSLMLAGSILVAASCSGDGGSAELSCDDESEIRAAEEKLKTALDSIDTSVFDSPAGEVVTVDGVTWSISNGLSKKSNEYDWLKDSETYDNPVTYQRDAQGYLVKNDKIDRKVDGGVYFDPEGEQRVCSTEEIDLLRRVAEELPRNQSS